MLATPSRSRRLDTTRNLNRRAPDAPAAHACEELEPRRLLAVVNGTDGNDSIVVDLLGDLLRVLVNGGVAGIYGDPASLTLTINANGGNDSVRIDANAGAQITVDGGNGDDALNLATNLNGGNLEALPGPTTLIGGPGTDSVITSDIHNAAGASFTITQARFDRPGWGGFFYDIDIESLRLVTGPAADTVNVLSTYPNQLVRIGNNGSTDDVYVGNESQGVQGIRGKVFVEPAFPGSTGARALLYINDTGDNAPRLGSFDFEGTAATGRLTGLAPAAITWTNDVIPSVYVTTGSAADQLTVFASNSPLHLYSAGGLDSVIVGAASVGGLQHVAETILVENTPASSTLTITDAGSFAPKSGRMLVNGAWAGVEGLVADGIYWKTEDVHAVGVTTGNASDTFVVQGADRNFTLNNAGGADAFTIGDPAFGGLARVTGNVTVFDSSGGAASTLKITDAGSNVAKAAFIDFAGSSTNQRITDFAVWPIVWRTNQIRNVTIETGAAADSVLVYSNANGNPLTVTNTGGRDAVTLGSPLVGGTQYISGPVYVATRDASILSDLTLDDRGHSLGKTISHNWSPSATQMQTTGMAPAMLAYHPSLIATLTVLAGDGADTFDLRATYRPGAKFFLDTGGGDDFLNIRSGEFSVVRLIEPVVEVAQIMMEDGTLILDGPADQVVRTRSLSIPGSGDVDLQDKALIVDYDGASPLDTVRALVTRGYNAGAWNGWPGINSSIARTTPGTGIGYAEAADLFGEFPAAWLGQDIDDTAVLIRHTLLGDADLDHTVNLADFNRLASGFGAIGDALWSRGDFNYDRSVNLTDFNLLAGRFGASLGSRGAAATSASLPIVHRRSTALVDDLVT